MAGVSRLVIDPRRCYVGLMTTKIADLTDAEGVALIDCLSVSTKTYTTLAPSVEDMMNLLRPAPAVEPIIRWQVERAFNDRDWVFVGKVTDAITEQIPFTNRARWSGWSRL